MKNTIQTFITFLFLSTVFMNTNSHATKWIVNVQSNSFSPNSLPSVQMGDTIRWVWINGSHTTTSLTIPPLAATWDHPLNVSNPSFEYVPTVTGLYNYKCTPHFPGMVGSFTVLMPPGFTLTLKTFLEGPFSNGEMNTALNDNGNLPLFQPYNTSPWNYPGTESVANIPNANIVDWVLVDLRQTNGDASSATPATIIARKAGFITKDGLIVSTDGASSLQFTINVTQDLYAVVWHRNHLNIITATPLVLSSGNYNYDFSVNAGQAWGSTLAQKELSPGIWGLMAGNGNGDNFLDLPDKSVIWQSQGGTAGYKSGDFNMNTHVENQDKNDNWIENNGNISQVPL